MQSAWRALRCCFSPATVLMGAALSVSAAGADEISAQTYRFGEHVMVVSPASPRLAQTAPQEPRTTHGMQVIPVSNLQTSQPTVEPAVATTEADGGLPPAPVGPCVTCGTEAAALSRAQRYQEIYEAIPFSRVEYDANPSYRHDAAMEMLFGQMRPTVIQRSKTEVDVNLPEIQVSPWAYSPYGFNSLFYPFYTPIYRGGRVYRSF